MTSINDSESTYAGVPLPEVRITTTRLLSADTTETVLNALVTVENIRQINLKGESLPSKIGSGPNKGLPNNHSERRTIKFGEKEIELHHMVGDIFIELDVADDEELKATVDSIDAAVKDKIPFGYTLVVGRYSKYRPTLSDYY
ncbi:MAG: methyl-coenzyme M reductase operon protein D [Candidatus Methanomethylophilaceae archaeon]